MQQDDAVQTPEEGFSPLYFGARLRNERESRGWSQRRLSDELGKYGVKLDASAITRIERGTREVKLREADAIARCMQLLIDDFVDSSPLDPIRMFWRAHEAALTHAQKARAHLAEMAQCMARAAVAVDLLAVQADEEWGDADFDGAAFLRSYASEFPGTGPEAFIDVHPATLKLLNQIAAAVAKHVVARKSEDGPETQSTRGS